MKDEPKSRVKRCSCLVRVGKKGTDWHPPGKAGEKWSWMTHAKHGHCCVPIKSRTRSLELVVVVKKTLCIKQRC